MSTYLSDITSRSIQPDQRVLMPSFAMAETVQPGPAFDAGVENADNSYEDAASMEPVQKNTVQVQPVPVYPSRPAEIHKTVLPYLTRHTDRIMMQDKVFLNDETMQTGPVAPVNFERNKPDAVATEIKPVKVLNEKPVYSHTDTTTEGLAPAVRPDDQAAFKKAPLILPSEKHEIPGNANDGLNNPGITRITPSLPALETNRPADRRSNQAPSKLVIGKITVEILPPATQPLPKVITRVVQSPPAETHSNINRLKFGLGQL